MSVPTAAALPTNSRGLASERVLAVLADAGLDVSKGLADQLVTTVIGRRISAPCVLIVRAGARTYRRAVPFGGYIDVPARARVYAEPTTYDELHDAGLKRLPGSPSTYAFAEIIAAYDGMHCDSCGRSLFGDCTCAPGPAIDIESEGR